MVNDKQSQLSCWTSFTTCHWIPPVSSLTICRCEVQHNNVPNPMNVYSVARHCGQPADLLSVVSLSSRLDLCTPNFASKDGTDGTVVLPLKDWWGMRSSQAVCSTIKCMPATNNLTEKSTSAVIRIWINYVRFPLSTIYLSMTLYKLCQIFLMHNLFVDDTFKDDILVKPRPS